MRRAQPGSWLSATLKDCHCRHYTPQQPRVQTGLKCSYFLRNLLKASSSQGQKYPYFHCRKVLPSRTLPAHPCPLTLTRLSPGLQLTPVIEELLVHAG